MCRICDGRWGDFVFAIGNPPEIGQTVTAGIVSGLHRTNVGLGPYEDFIQTDAAIYPGHSGGALVDLRGDLVGINTAFMAVRKNNPGMSFAIPINMASALLDQMLEFGDIRRGVKLGEALRSQYELARPLSEQLYALVKELERRETVVLDFMATPRLRKQIAPHVTRAAVALRHGSAPQPWSLAQRK